MAGVFLTPAIFFVFLTCRKPQRDNLWENPFFLYTARIQETKKRYRKKAAFDGMTGKDKPMSFPP